MLLLGGSGTLAVEKTLPSFNPHRYGTPEYDSYYEASRKEDSVIAGYREIADAFNRTLAGRYPFGPLTTKDAHRRDVCEFYRRHEPQLKRLQSGLAALKDSKAEILFLGQLDTAGAFLAGTACSRFNHPLRIGMRPEETDPITSQPARVWTLTDDFGRARFPHGASTLDWRFGAPMALKVSWTAHTGLRPRPATGNDAFETPDSVTISFRMTGDWALMRFVDTFRAPYGWSRDEDSAAVRLRFQAPLIPTLAPSTPSSASAVMIEARPRESWVPLKVTLQFEHYGAGKPRAPLKWPEPFPVTAP